MTLRQWLMAGALLAACGAAQAQWAWKDANGRPVYSDRPPPTSVPAARIFKAPRGQMAEVPEPPAPKAPPTLAERNAAYEQRRASVAEGAAKQADEAKAKAARAASCDSARNNQRARQGRTGIPVGCPACRGVKTQRGVGGGALPLAHPFDAAQRRIKRARLAQQYKSD
jgi:hypothetical protein